MPMFNWAPTAVNILWAFLGGLKKSNYIHMKLAGIVAVAGRSGLFKLIGQNKAGVILESLDNLNLKIVANLANQKFSSLEDITVFSTTDEDIKLSDIFLALNNFSGEMPDVKNRINSDLLTFFRQIAPDYDQSRVYASDVKKIVSWYKILSEKNLLSTENDQTESVESSDDSSKS